MRCATCRDPLDAVWVSNGNTRTRYAELTEHVAAKAWPAHCEPCLDRVAASVERVTDRLIPLVLMQMWVDA